MISIVALTSNRFAITCQYLPGVIDNLGNIDCEILIWDNGSSDGTFDWLTEFAKTDDRISIFGAEHNIGLEAVNYLAKEANGEYILKVDDDIEVPEKFAERLVAAYEKVCNEKIAFLGWDMQWANGKTFALRSGKKLYKPPQGEMVDLGNGYKVLIHYTPSRWMVNGPCRLSKRETFLEIGGHPEGVKYGVDHLVSIAAEKNGYYIAYLSGEDIVIHRGVNDNPEYRKMKDAQLARFGCPKDV